MRNRRNLWYYIQNYKFNSLFIKNFLLILVLIVIPLSGISGILYANTYRMIRSEVESTGMNSLNRIKDIVDTIFFDVDKLAAYISMESEVRVFMSSKDPGSILKNFETDIIKKIKMYPMVYSYIDSVYLYSEKSSFMLSNNGRMQLSEDESWYEAYLQNDTGFPWIQGRKYTDGFPFYISIINPVDITHYRGKTGAVIININAEKLGDMLMRTKNNTSEHIFILDDRQNILYASERKYITANMNDLGWYRELPVGAEDFSDVLFINDEEHHVASVQSQYSGGSYVSLIPFRNFQQRLDQIIGLMIFLLFVVFFVAIVFTFLITFQTYRPVKNIMSVVEGPTDTDGSVTKDNTVNSGELRYITDRIMATIYSNKDLEEQLNRRIKMLNKSQSQALQAQINPHFLYNALETINWKAVSLSNGRNEVSSMISQLAKLLRLSINTNDPLIPFGEEIEHAKCYIEIMKVRCNDTFDVIWDIDGALMEYKVLKLSLQPVIENAIQHGFMLKRLSGTIRISAVKSEKKIVIEVLDDGAGMPPDEMERLNKNLEEDCEFSDEHIGLQNVNQRIRLIFGPNNGIMLTNGDNRGTLVRIQLPIVR